MLLLNTLLCKIATMRTMLAMTIATSQKINNEQTNEKCNTTTSIPTPSIVSLTPPLKKKVKFARENQIYLIPTNDEIREYLPDMYWRFSDSNNKKNSERPLHSSGIYSSIYMDITMFHDIPILTTNQWKILQMTKGSSGSFYEIPEKGRMIDNCCYGYGGGYSGGYSGSYSGSYNYGGSGGCGYGYEKIRTRIRI